MPQGKIKNSKKEKSLKRINRNVGSKMIHFNNLFFFKINLPICFYKGKHITVIKTKTLDSKMRKKMTGQITSNIEELMAERCHQREGKGKLHIVKSSEEKLEIKSQKQKDQQRKKQREEKIAKILKETK